MAEQSIFGPPEDWGIELTEEELEASKRFGQEEFGGLIWHADGRPFSRRDYRVRGANPPPRSKIARMKREGRMCS